MCQSNHQSVDHAMIPQLKIEEQVHALVLRLLQQVMNPAMVALERAQTTQMSVHPTNHTWHASNGFKEDASIHPATLVKFVGVVACRFVKNTARRGNHLEHNIVFNSIWCLVRELDIVGGLLRVDWMRHPVAFRVQNHLMLNHTVNQLFVRRHCSFLVSKFCILNW